MKNSKKWMWALSVAFLFVTITAFAVTNNINPDKSVGNNTEIEKVTKADCDKCDKADCDGKCTSKCKGKKGNKAKASAKKSCSPHKGASAKKSCSGKSDAKADASSKKTTEEAAKK